MTSRSRPDAVAAAHEALVAAAAPAGAVDPSWPWSAREAAAAAAQLAVAEAICAKALPALREVETRLGAGARPRSAARVGCADQALRNTLAALRDLPLASMPAEAARTLAWRLAMERQMRCTVRGDVEPTGDALADAVFALARCLAIVCAETGRADPAADVACARAGVAARGAGIADLAPWALDAIDALATLATAASAVPHP